MKSAAGYGLALLAFLLPFEMMGSFQISGTTLRPPQIAGYLLICLFLVGVATKRLHLSVPATQLRPLVLFALVPMLPALIMAHPRGWINYLAFVLNLLLVVTVASLLTKDNLKLVLWGLYAGAGVACAVALYQYVGDTIGLPGHVTGLRASYQKSVLGFPRVHGPANEPLYLGNILLLPLLTAFVAAMVRGSQRVRILFAVLVFTLLLTTSRGAMAAAGLGALFALGAVRLRYKSLPLRALGGTIGRLIIAGAILLAIPAALSRGALLDGPRTFIELSTSRLTQSSSYLERAAGLERAGQVFSKRWLIGVGVGQFRFLERPLPAYRLDYDDIHLINFWWALAVETGLLGLGLFLWFLYGLFKSGLAALKSSRPDEFVLLAGGLSALAAVLFQIFSFYALNFVHLWFLLGWVLGLVRLFGVEKRLGAGT